MNKQLSACRRTLIGALYTVFILAATAMQAQTVSPQRVEAQAAVAAKDYTKALPLYKELYEASPNETYQEYLNVLLSAEKYKDAEKLVLSRMQNSFPATLFIDLGRVYKAQKKEAKAAEQYTLAVNRINGDDILTQKLTAAFTEVNELEYAIEAYKRAIQLTGNPYAYNAQIANLYIKTGQLDKALDQVLQIGVGQFLNTEAIETMFLEWMGNDPKKLQLAQKNLIRRINENPDNVNLPKLLTWIYTQRGDWEGALIQMEALDERNKGTGRELMEYAGTANNAKQYSYAQKAYDDVIAKGNTNPFYIQAKGEKLKMGFNQLKEDPNSTLQQATSLLALFDSFFVEYPGLYASPFANNYAELAALYADQPKKGISILQTAIQHPDTKRAQAGALKLQQADYNVLIGKIWDASLLYSQVDKDFKQDFLGEDARYRNARLAYYRGDFSWAQRQLDVLKASTSELIANDALSLSVLITENAEDSNYYPLNRFAYADLLLFQNKDSIAEKLLDSVAAAFPKHGLNDDILLLRSKMDIKHHKYTQAIDHLKEIVAKYGTDVLGDDALYNIADIYLNDLNDKENARKYYEQLIIDFPGSTFVQSARQQLNELKSPSSTP